MDYQMTVHIYPKTSFSNPEPERPLFAIFFLTNLSLYVSAISLPETVSREN